jgi:hypothetical protein
MVGRKNSEKKAQALFTNNNAHINAHTQGE